MSIRAELVGVALGLSLAGCAASSMVGRQSEAREALTPTELIATAEARQGEIVTLTGYFGWRTDTLALWDSRGALVDAEQERRGAKFDYWSRCVTVYPASGSARRLSDRRVRVTGKVTIIHRDDIRSLWTCNRVALEEAMVSSE
jgi:hypothetical protein